MEQAAVAGAEAAAVVPVAREEDEPGGGSPHQGWRGRGSSRGRGGAGWGRLSARSSGKAATIYEDILRSLLMAEECYFFSLFSRFLFGSVIFLVLQLSSYYQTGLFNFFSFSICNPI